MNNNDLLTRRTAVAAICLGAGFFSLRSLHNSREQTKENLNSSASELADCLDKIREILEGNFSKNEIIPGAEHNTLHMEINYALKKISECVQTAELVLTHISPSDINTGNFYDLNISQIPVKAKTIPAENTPKETEKYVFLLEKLTKSEYRILASNRILPSDNDDQVMQKLTALSSVLAKTYSSLNSLTISAAYEDQPLAETGL